mmetsp:Transcript_12463/g.16776  ORF Transcript_12463/g.16776 Transcript_12463/m.16776 type:complete len:88 (-) Transcript_12463:71-334(-)
MGHNEPRRAQFTISSTLVTIYSTPSFDLANISSTFPAWTGVFDECLRLSNDDSTGDFVLNSDWFKRRLLTLVLAVRNKHDFNAIPSL